MEPPAPLETLHLYAQQYWHDHALIVGTREALTQLRDALTAAIESPSGTASASFFCSDGEGYEAWCLCASEAEMERFLLPYTAEEAQDHRAHCHWPQPPPGRP